MVQSANCFRPTSALPALRHLNHNLPERPALQMIQRIGKTLKRVFGGNDRFDALPIRGASQVLQRPLMADADALNRNAPQNQWIDRCAQHVFLQNVDHGYPAALRSEEHTSELQSLMRNSYAVFCLKTKR